MRFRNACSDKELDIGTPGGALLKGGKLGQISKPIPPFNIKSNKTNWISGFLMLSQKYVRFED